MSSAEHDRLGEIGSDERNDFGHVPWSAKRRTPTGHGRRPACDTETRRGFEGLAAFESDDDPGDHAVAGAHAAAQLDRRCTEPDDRPSFNEQGALVGERNKDGLRRSGGQQEPSGVHDFGIR